MIRCNGEYRLEERVAMRNGNGTVKIEHLLVPGTELRSRTRLCGRLTLEPGVSIGLHTHENEEEIFHIISGEAEVNDNGEIRKVRSGDTILTGNGAGHAIANISATEALVILATIISY